MSFKSQLGRLARLAVDAGVRALRNRARSSSGSNDSRRRTRGQGGVSPSPPSGTRGRTSGTSYRGSSTSDGRSLPGGVPSPYGADSARELDDSFLPQFDYAPANDGDADPGEVVWTWIPYEEDPTVGKDRPALVLARMGSDVVVAQLTSKDHDREAEYEAQQGRYWMDVGSGDWDSRGRPSEVRLDRLLVAGQGAIRREGGVLPRNVFDQVVAAMRALHGSR